jgi:hypothetical protein
MRACGCARLYSRLHTSETVKFTIVEQLEAILPSHVLTFYDP